MWSRQMKCTLLYGCGVPEFKCYTIVGHDKVIEFHVVFQLPLVTCTDEKMIQESLGVAVNFLYFQSVTHRLL